MEPVHGGLLTDLPPASSWKSFGSGRGRNALGSLGEWRQATLWLQLMVQESL